MHTRERLAHSAVLLLVGIVAVAAVVDRRVAARFAALPYWGSITHRLAGYAPDSPQPGFHTGIDVSIFQRSARIIPVGSTYAIEPVDRRGASLTDTYSAGRLYFPWAFPVTNPRDARWILSIGHRPVLAPGQRRTREYVVGRRAYLVEVAR